MILFTSSITFRLAAGGDLFTPKSVYIEPLLSHSTSPKVRPVVAGERLYFVNDRKSGSFVHEFTLDEASGIKQAPSLSDHVQGYIPSNIHLMVADDDLKFLALVSKDDPATLYVYKWLWVGQEKVQAAWQKWQIDSPILGAKLMDEELILVTDRGSEGREIVSLNCHEAWQGGGGWPFVPLLDRMVRVQSGTYNPQTDSTSFTLPYKAEGAVALQSWPSVFGLKPAVLSAQGQVLTLQGNINTAIFAGFPFESSCVLSSFHHRTTDNHGSFGNAVAGMRLMVANFLLETGDCAYLKVTLERDYRSPFVYQLSATANSTKTAKFGAVVMGKLDKTLSILSRAPDFRLKIEGSSPYPYALLSYRWTGGHNMVPISKHGIVTPTTLADIRELNDNPRPQDRREVEDISDHCLMTNLMFALTHANPCLTARTHANELLCIAGVIPTSPLQGAIAMIGTRNIEKNPHAFLRGSKEILHQLQNHHYEFLYNVVDARNALHVRYLKWLGFSMIRRVEGYGAAQIPVIEFAKIFPVQFQNPKKQGI